MKLNNLGPNQVEIQDGVNSILFSYDTPVAVLKNGKFYRTNKKWSVTTSRHINKWLNGAIATEKKQEFFDSLV